MAISDDEVRVRARSLPDNPSDATLARGVKAAAMDGTSLTKTQVFNIWQAMAEETEATPCAQKTAAEINVERIEAIILGYYSNAFQARCAARKIVEAFPKLRPHQQTSEPDGSSRVIARPVPWKIDT